MFLFYLVNSSAGKAKIITRFHRHDVFALYNPSECVFMVPRFTWSDES